MNYLNNVLNKAPNPFKNSTQTENSEETNIDVNSNGNNEQNSNPEDASGKLPSLMIKFYQYSFEIGSLKFEIEIQFQ